MWIKYLFYPFELIFAFFIKFYKKCISPILPHTCRFTPSCSSYALTALKRFGVIKGSFLAIKRILRCSPGHKGGYDPVPPNIKGDSRAHRAPFSPAPRHPSLQIWHLSESTDPFVLFSGQQIVFLVLCQHLFFL